MRIRRGAFSLVELLVMLAIISVLAAMLLPSLERGLDEARKAVCLNNTRQMYMAARMYAESYNDYYPAPSRFASISDASGGDYMAGTNCPVAPSDPTGIRVSTAWYQMIFRLELLPKEVPDCPSMDFRATLLPNNCYNNITHYFYRYNDWSNNCRSGLYYRKSYFYDPATANQPLFSDRWGFGRSSTAPYETLARTPAIYCGGPFRFAHLTGGNVMGHTGAARFVPEYFTGGRSSSWPCDAATAYSIAYAPVIAYFNAH